MMELWFEPNLLSWFKGDYKACSSSSIEGVWSPISLPQVCARFNDLLVDGMQWELVSEISKTPVQKFGSLFPGFCDTLFSGHALLEYCVLEVAFKNPKWPHGEDHWEVYWDLRWQSGWLSVKNQEQLSSNVSNESSFIPSPVNFCSYFIASTWETNHFWWWHKKLPQMERHLNNRNLLSVFLRVEAWNQGIRGVKFLFVNSGEKYFLASSEF